MVGTRVVFQHFQAFIDLKTKMLILVSPPPPLPHLGYRVVNFVELALDDFPDKLDVISPDRHVLVVLFSWEKFPD